MNIPKPSKNKFVLLVMVCIVILINTFKPPFRRETPAVSHIEEYHCILRNDYYIASIMDNSPNGSQVNPMKTKVILTWQNLFSMADIPNEYMFSPCPINDCYITSDPNYMPLHRFDAVVFHSARWNHQIHGMPVNRNRDQKYVFMTHESPYLTYVDTDYNEHFYNWTMTYRRDSDIHYPYGVILKKTQTLILPTQEEIINRPKLVAWIVSNCRKEANVRRHYVKELSRYIPIDVYGSCGNLSCGSSGDCMQMIARQYKFYLSFENTHCMDYVTEKLYNALRLNIVPIVLGGGIDYKNIAPPHSVIDTSDFVSPKHLAEYLSNLNSTEYLKYFDWKKNYSIASPIAYVMCQLCEKLHQPLKYSSYENIQQWFFGFNKCHF